jgi:competence protein ComFC
MITKYLRKTIDIFVPKVCLLCGEKITHTRFICDGCAEFELNRPPFCQKCGITISEVNSTRICTDCVKTSFYFNRCFSPFVFKEPLAGLIHKYKYQGYKSLGGLLGERLFRCLKDSYFRFWEYDLITYVPLHKQKLRQREYNQSFILAEYIAERSGLPLVKALSVKKYIKPQVDKGYSQRQAGLRGNFILNADISDKKIILVDDVFTTGATLSECSRVLKKNKASQIAAVTLAIVK